MQQQLHVRRVCGGAEQMKRPLRDPLQLSEAEQRELEWLAKHASARVARRARIILARGSGYPFKEIARRFRIHPNTVRNCVLNFCERGIPGLMHAATGTARPLLFDEDTKSQIIRIAQSSPRSLGLARGRWSLRLLRSYLLEQGLIYEISVEGLRQLLRGSELPPQYWRRARHLRLRLTPAVERVLQVWRRNPQPGRRLLAQVLLAAHEGRSDEEIAAALGVALNHVRTWIRSFRRRGLDILQARVTRAALFLERQMRRQRRS